MDREISQLTFKNDSTGVINDEISEKPDIPGAHYCHPSIGQTLAWSRFNKILIFIWVCEMAEKSITQIMRNQFVHVTFFYQHTQRGTQNANLWRQGSGGLGEERGVGCWPYTMSSPDSLTGESSRQHLLQKERHKHTHVKLRKNLWLKENEASTDPCRHIHTQTFSHFVTFHPLILMYRNEILW